MNKTSVLAYFGGNNATARALGVSKTTVSLWNEKLPWRYALLASALTNNALKFNRHEYPEKFMNVCKQLNHSKRMKKPQRKEVRCG